MLNKFRKVYYKALDLLITKSFSSSDDEYWNWLQFANSGMLHKGNIYSMNFAILIGKQQQSTV